MTSTGAIVAVIVAAALLGLAILAAKRLFLTCGPDEILVLTGRTHRAPDGSVRGYRVVVQGWTIRVPMSEKVYRMSTRPMSIGVRPDSAMTQDRVKVTILATAKVTLSRQDRMVHHAVKRFLTIQQDMIKPLARKEIERSLTKLVASKSSEELQRSSKALSKEFHKKVSRDLAHLGLEVEFEKLQFM